MIYVMGDGGTDITHYGIQPGGGRKGVVVGYDDISGPGQGIYMPAGQIGSISCDERPVSGGE